MRPAWVSCLSFSIRDEAIFAQFRADTGEQWQLGRTPLDRMIDKAAGRDRAALLAFIRWFNKNVWGEAGKPGAVVPE